MLVFSEGVPFETVKGLVLYLRILNRKKGRSCSKSFLDVLGR